MGSGSDGRAKRHVLRATYASLLDGGEWRPIQGCPGRLVLPAPVEASPQDLLGSETLVTIYDDVASARDPVAVARVEGGGLISYRQSDGQWVHTLNTPDGFARKLEQLGIAAP